ncbi:hypothetical protein NQZ68_027452 [Dissostichus eleginoides]|nr:hypothetical protein NQZ68_027452 [Dissostichus eleginoides]
MPPLTSTAGCNGCFRLNQKISELEGRISVLHQIRDDEEMLDSLITMGPTATTTAGELDSTVPWMGVAARSDHWTVLGAKPKAPVSSTPSQKEPWMDARRGKHSGKLTCRPTPPQALQLTNQFSIRDEEDFPPLADPLFPCRRRLHSARLRPEPPSALLTAALGDTPPSHVQALRRRGPVFPCHRRLHSARLRPEPPNALLTAALGDTPPSHIQAPSSSPLAPLQQATGLHTTRPLTTIQLHSLICSSGIHKPDQDPQAISSCFTDYW